MSKIVHPAIRLACFVRGVELAFTRVLARARRHRTCLSAVAVLAFFGSALSAHAADTPPIASIPGKYEVTPQGAFSYSIPIIVPPGTANMVPDLSLSYSSHNGDGPEGMGWTLTGLPTITRCPQTIAQNNAHGTVTFGQNATVTDRFCFNGQQLILINGGSGGHTYGDNLAEYRTELETFTRFVSYTNGGTGSGPAYFLAWTKAGQKIEFGNTADSQVPLVPVPGSQTGPTGTVKAWAVDKITDTKGNYLSVTYNCSTNPNCSDRTTNGEVYPVEIDYTGNAQSSPVLLPFNSVQFNYNTTQHGCGVRPDITPYYQSGSVSQNTVLLCDIRTYNGTGGTATLVHDYELSYSLASSGAAHDELTSVSLCDPNGACLSPTTFGWQGSQDQLTYSTVNVTAPELPAPAGFAFGDFNGDGLTDIVREFGNTMYFPFGNLFTCPPSQSTPFYLGTSTPGTFTAANPTVTSSSGATEPFCMTDGYLADFSGDGLSDVYEQYCPFSCEALVAINNGAGTGFSIAANDNVIAGSSLGDFNGDGRMDLIYWVPNANTTYISLSNGNGTFTTQPGYQGISFYNGVADFDGDGCFDFAGGSQPGTTATYYMCNPAVAVSRNTQMQQPSQQTGELT